MQYANWNNQLTSIITLKINIVASRLSNYGKPVSRSACGQASLFKLRFGFPINSFIPYCNE